jgi:hypothetical protein
MKPTLAVLVYAMVLGPAGLAAPVDLPGPPEELAAEAPAPYPVGRVVPVPTPAGCAACRQTRSALPWERLRSRLRRVGPAAGYFVVQDLHGVWPAGTPDAPPYKPPAETAAPPLSGGPSARQLGGEK